ncbi:MAG TPA: ethanolamine ammonia-lyase reactivating factor EutA, partial [Phyllobacterium sp.]|nr:ethanolamine ammonia-lyase reactivating factor EutA [Phyllobacterium sp.]
FLYADTDAGFSDLGPLLAKQLRRRLEDWRPRLERPEQGIRATVVGASQYTVQVSGSTIFVRPLDALPVRNVPVIKPAFAFEDDIDADQIGAMVKGALARLDLTHGDSPVAICYEWQGSASYRRLDDFCLGIRAGLSAILAKGHPLILVGDNDVGGLVGMHFVSAEGVNSIISIDGIKLDEFDFIDIGAMLETSGAVPVVIKSLVFPNMGIGQKGLDPAEPA